VLNNILFYKSKENKFIEELWNAVAWKYDNPIENLFDFILQLVHWLVKTLKNLIQGHTKFS
jgi:hypothetical protein